MATGSVPEYPATFIEKKWLVLDVQEVLRLAKLQVEHRKVSLYPLLSHSIAKNGHPLTTFAPVDTWDVRQDPPHEVLQEGYQQGILLKFFQSILLFDFSENPFDVVCKLILKRVDTSIVAEKSLMGHAQ